MEYELVGWPEDGPTLDLDHREFSYAGKFVMSNSGKAVVRSATAAGGGDGRSGQDDSIVASGDTADADATDGDGDSELVAAIAFNEDRTDSATAWLRYVTVRRDRRGEGIGARLSRFAADRLAERGYDRVKIAVNNPFAYHALHKAGFRYTGEQTGLAELVLVRPPESSRERSDAGHQSDPDAHQSDLDAYQSGLDVYREREDLAPEEREFLTAKADEGPPDVLASPVSESSGRSQ
jgi:GNAT superfamily N-acetyltransferase